MSTFIYYSGTLPFYGATLHVEDVEIEVEGRFDSSSDSYEHGAYDTSDVHLKALYLVTPEGKSQPLDLALCPRDMIEQAEDEIARDYEATGPVSYTSFYDKDAHVLLSNLAKSRRREKAA